MLHKFIEKYTLPILISIVFLGLLYNCFWGSIGKEVNRKLYIKALAYQQDGEFKKAYYAFGKINSTYSAYPAVLYRQAISAENLADEKTAIEKYKLILKKYPQSSIAPKASYNWGRAYIRIEEKIKAKKQFRKTIHKYPQTSYSIASYFYLGELNFKSSKIIAQQYYLKYLQLSPSGRFIQESIDNITKLNQPLNNEEKYIFAKALYNNKNYGEAKKYFFQLPIEKSWYYLGNIYNAQREQNKALTFFEKGFSIKNYTIIPSQVMYAMSLYNKIDARSSFDSWKYLENKSKSVSSPVLDYVLYKKAQYAPQKLAIYSEIVNKFPNGDYASEALWNLFWYEFSNKNYAKAIELGEKQFKQRPDEKTTPKILFWTAKAYERLNNSNLAESSYKKLLDQYSDDYYAYRAYGRLKALNNQRDNGWLTNTNAAINKNYKNLPLPYDSNYLNKKYGIMEEELLLAGDYELAQEAPIDDILKSWILYQQGDKSRSIVVARDYMDKLLPKPDRADARWALVYPLYYVNDINKYSTKNSVDPVIALSLMREESYFNPEAVSSSNAKGLMQLLPGTANDIANWKNISTYGESLFDPEYNIQLGTAYIGHVQDRLNSSLYAVAAYNGGPNAVANWVTNRPNRDKDEFIENIPFDQTRTYVKKVFRSYWNYKRIYGF